MMRGEKPGGHGWHPGHDTTQTRVRATIRTARVNRAELVSPKIKRPSDWLPQDSAFTKVPSVHYDLRSDQDAA